MDNHNADWVHLTSGKEYSRLLYTNPVCFLCTVDRNKDIDSEKKTFTSSNTKVQLDRENRSNYYDIINSSHKAPHIDWNVMVLSWLTPTNNRGQFMFSIKKSRHSTSLLAPPVPNTMNEFQTGVEFSLSVPVKGMERLVLDVGSVSGRFRSKFPYPQPDCDTRHERYDNQSDELKKSNRQKKKFRKEQLSTYGIQGLTPVPLGDVHPLEHSPPVPTTLNFFAIRGTVAHMCCRTYSVTPMPFTDTSSEETSNLGNHRETDLSTSSQIDDDHILIIAQVIDAYVQPSYWDCKKLIFCPQGTEAEAPPYMTFFGSQTFGYVRK